MNLPEVIVASGVFLAACSGAAQMGASSAQAMALGRQRSDLLEQIELQFLAVAPVLRAAQPAVPLGCPAAARLMQQQLAQGLPPLAPGLQRQVVRCDWSVWTGGSGCSRRYPRRCSGGPPCVALSLAPRCAAAVLA